MSRDIRPSMYGVVKISTPNMMNNATINIMSLLFISFPSNFYPNILLGH